MPKKSKDKLLSQIAAFLGQDEEEVKKVATTANRYSHDEMMMEGQSVLNFYKIRINERPPERKQGESVLKFTQRQQEYEAKYNEWKFKECETCKEEFAYAYTYDGVKFCSLDCLQSALEGAGLKFTPGRDLRKRWGTHHPAVVSSTALAELKSANSDHSSAFSSDPVRLPRQTHQEDDSHSHSEDTQVESHEDNSIDNTV